MMELNRIYNVDCFEAMREIADETIDCIITDPPYGTTGCYWDKKIDVQQLMDELMRVIKPNGAVIIFSQLPFGCDVINACRKWYRYEWIYEKTMAVGFLNANKMPLRAHENLLLFYKHLPTYNPQLEYKEPGKRDRKNEKHPTVPKIYQGKTAKIPWISENGERKPRDVIRISNTNYGSIHPTQKPEPLITYLIKTYTNENETVLDPFSGSGTTAVCCRELNRNFIAFELDETYYKDSVKRLESRDLNVRLKY